jgi:L-2,4-diaminobutyrate decarboxylase
MYMGHQTSAPLAAGMWMESVISALNQSLAVREMSPTATMIEHQLVRWFSRLIGYGDNSGGTMTSGGTEANFTALLAARNHALPDAWEKGVGDDPPVVLYGEHAHYAVTRAIGQLGLGRRHGISIPSRDYRLDVDKLVDALARARSDGKRVMAVVATAGSTATGSFDDLEAIATVCRERDLWLHVDAAHGASALLSANPPRALNGLRHARTLAWDPHKGMLLPLAAGMVLAREERDLDGAFAQQAPYLFSGPAAGSGPTPARIPDQGVRSFQCSRRADVLKVWFVIQRYGAAALGEIYDHLCATARNLYEAIEEHAEFENLHEPESNILCFRHVGRRKGTSEQASRLAGSRDAARAYQCGRHRDRARSRGGFAPRRHSLART